MAATWFAVLLVLKKEQDFQWDAVTNIEQTRGSRARA